MLFWIDKNKRRKDAKDIQDAFYKGNKNLTPIQMNVIV